MVAKESVPDDGHQPVAPDAGAEVDPDPADPRYLADHRASLDPGDDADDRPKRTKRES